MSTITMEIHNGLAVIRLNRPEKYNAFNRETALQMQAYLDECAKPGVRAVVITGNGKAFSSGQDLEEVTAPGGPDVTRILKEHYNPIIMRIRKLEKPVIAAVNGVAAGAGANIALACDIVVASAAASFIQAFSKIGLIPDSGGTYFLPRLIGMQKAVALSMLGEKVTAEDAERMGMIYKVFPVDSFEQEWMTMASLLASMPTRGLALTKQAFNMSLNTNLEDQLHDEEILQERAGKTSDYREGVAAFLEKRKPQFTGA